MKSRNEVVPVCTTLAALIASKKAKERALYMTGNWWYREEPLRKFLAYAKLPETIYVRSKPIEYLPAVGIREHWAPKGQRILSMAEAVFAAVQLKIEGKDLVAPNAVLVGYDEKTKRAFMLWHLSGRLLLNTLNLGLIAQRNLVIATGL